MNYLIISFTHTPNGVLGFWGFGEDFIWMNFLGDIFCEDFFGRIFLGGFF